MFYRWGNERCLLASWRLMAAFALCDRVLSMVDLAKREGFDSVLLPQENASEARLITDIRIYAIHHLADLIPVNDHAQGTPDGQVMEFLDLHL
ncbi:MULTISPECIES: hypothetical protein [Paenibacillus]|uniref:hypothetical protein n=2 Tax=Paenibacillus TaxID=44249 RepID=UPI0021B451DE|nr:MULTISPECIES: hypothetical protein [Paenibacillus]